MAINLVGTITRRGLTIKGRITTSNSAVYNSTNARPLKLGPEP